MLIFGMDRDHSKYFIWITSEDDSVLNSHRSKTNLNYTLQLPIGDSSSSGKSPAKRRVENQKIGHFWAILSIFEPFWAFFIHFLKLWPICKYFDFCQSAIICQRNISLSRCQKKTRLIQWDHNSIIWLWCWPSLFYLILIKKGVSKHHHMSTQHFFVALPK